MRAIEKEKEGKEYIVIYKTYFPTVPKGVKENPELENMVDPGSISYIEKGKNQTRIKLLYREG